MADQSSSPLLKVPLEVLLRITRFLTTKELGNLRLTCRAAEQSLYQSFTREFFTIKQFMISQFSLQALIDISKSRLGPHLRRLHISTQQFSEHSADSRNVAGVDSPKAQRLRYYLASQMALWSSGEHIEMLTAALRGLTSVEEVVLRDFNSHTRSRDGPGSSWNSYGAVTIFEETGLWPSDRLNSSTDRAFLAVLYALGRSAMRPKALEVILRGSHLSDMACYIMPSYQSSIVPVLQGLEKLHLTISLNEAEVTAHKGRTPLLALHHFLTNASNLRELRINGPAWTTSPFKSPSGILTSLYTSLSPATAPPLSLTHLEHLSLGFAEVDPAKLADVLRRLAPTLRAFELWKVSLVLPPGGADPSKYTPADHALLPIKKLLRTLLTVPSLDLKYIKLGHFDVVVFGDTGPIMEYRGSDWKRHMQEQVLPTMKADISSDPTQHNYYDAYLGLELDFGETDEDMDELDSETDQEF